MALNGLFSIYDSKAKNYTFPYPAANTGVAVRMFTAAVQSEGSQWNMHPEDFTLFHLGEFDDENADLLQLDTPVRVCGAWEVHSPVQVQLDQEVEVPVDAKTNPLAAIQQNAEIMNERQGNGST